MTTETTPIPFSLGHSFPQHASPKCLKRPEVDLLTVKEARQCDVELQEDRYKLNHSDNWVPLFTNQVFVPGECVTFESGKYIEPIGLLDGLYTPRDRPAGSSKSTKNGGKAKLPLFELSLRQRGLSWANPGHISKVEEKSKLNRVHFLRTQLGGFKQLPDVRGNPGQSKLLHTVKRFRQVQVSLDIPEKTTLSFHKTKDCKGFKSFGIVTAVVYHEARFGTTEHEDLSYSESVSRESRSERGRNTRGSIDDDSDGEHVAAKAKEKEPRMLFISFVQIKELQLDAKDREILRPTRSFLSRLLPFGKRKTSEHDLTPNPPQSTLVSAKSTPATPTFEPQTGPLVEVKTQVEKSEKKSASAAVVHIWETVLAATLAEARSSNGGGGGGPSLVFLLVKNLEYLPLTLRNRLLPQEPLSEESVQRWFSERFRNDSASGSGSASVDFMGYANEFRYNFKGDPVPETLRRNFFRPSVLPLEHVNSLATCSVFAKNSHLEPLIGHLQNFRNLQLLAPQDCVALFKLIAKHSMSRPSAVDRYNPNRTRATLCHASLLRKRSQAALDAFVQAGELAEGPVDCGPLDQVESIGHAFLYSLGERASGAAREIAMDLIKLWDFRLMEEDFCVRIFKHLAPLVSAENVADLRRVVLAVKDLRVGGAAKVTGFLRRIDALEGISVEALRSVFSAESSTNTDITLNPNISEPVEKVATVQLTKKLDEADDRAQVWLCRTADVNLPGSRCVVTRFEAKARARSAGFVALESSRPESFAKSERVATIDGESCVVFPRCVETLETILETLADVEPTQRRKVLCSIAADMVRAVSALHEERQAHADLQLSSFGITQEGRVKLLLATVGDGKGSGNGNGEDQAVDISALAACLYKLDTMQSVNVETLEDDLGLLEVDEFVDPIRTLLDKDTGETEAKTKMKRIVETFEAVGKVSLTGRNSLLGSPHAVYTPKTDALFDIRLYLR